MSRATNRLLPNIVRSRCSRTRPFAKIVSLSGEIQNITYSYLDRICDWAACILSKDHPDDDKILYMGPSDIRYLIWLLAAIKTDKCIMFPSPGNTVAANQGLFKRTSATTLLYAPESAAMLSPLLEATRYSIKATVTPPYTDFFNRDPGPTFPFDHTFEKIKKTPFLGLHSSGTSGHPKAIYWDHAAAETLSSFLDPAFEGSEGPNSMKQVLQGNDVLVLFPLFHLGGIGPTIGSLSCDNSLVLAAPGTLPTPENITTILKHAGCTSLFIPPSILEAMLAYPPGMEILSTLKDVAYTGGPLNPIHGEELARHIPHLFPIIASTEGGPAHLVFSGDSSRWNAFKFLDVGQRMDEISPGFFELVIPRNDLVNRGLAYFHTSPHLQIEYPTSDLFSPAGDGWWIYRGRTDNWIALSNGEKMDPADMEHLVGAHPNVSGVLIAGSHRFRLCMLIELKQPPTTQAEKDVALAELWPLINEANQAAPKFGRVPKELVIFAKPDKPFHRASKGTIQRRVTVTNYTQEVDVLYSEVEEGLLKSGLPSLKSTEIGDLIPLLSDLYLQTLDLKNEKNFGIDEDLFSLGLDSLAAFLIVARLKAALRDYGVTSERLKFVNNKLVYSHTTIQRMAKALSFLLSGRDGEGTDGSAPSADHTKLENLVQKYGIELQTFRVNGNSHTSSIVQHTIILTGSTGSLGSYILSSLLTRPDVRRVFCLNRNPEARSKQLKSFKARNLPELLINDEKTIFLQAALHKPNLGLSREVYSTLVRETTSIIHNSFPVNFLLGIESFEPQFVSLVNLLKLSTENNNAAPVLFVSSIAAATPINGIQQSVLEAVLDADGSENILPQGYAQAKYICERLMQTYAVNSGGKAAILRVGQVCGPLEGTGTWNVSEWAPSLFVSSKFLRLAPSSIGSLEVNWVPVDKLGAIISELGHHTAQISDSGLVVYNIVNPKITQWKDLSATLNKVAPTIVTPEEWVKKLKKTAENTHLITSNPAVKLIDFYEQAMLSKKPAVLVEATHLLQASKVANDLPMIKNEHLDRWLQGWGL